MDRKQQAAHAAAEARCAAESATQRRSARMNELHACVNQQKATLAALQNLHEQIVQAPANVVNTAVVLFQRLEARGASSALRRFRAGADLQQAAGDDTFAVPHTSVSSISSMPRNGNISDCESNPTGMGELSSQASTEASSGACFRHQNNGYTYIPCTTDLARMHHSAGEILGQAGEHDHCHAPHHVYNTSCATDSVSLGCALSFSEDSSESDTEDYEPAPCTLLSQGTVVHSQGRLASQLYMRKLALGVLRSWSTLRLAALDAELAADAFCRMICTARALKKWFLTTVHLAQWREQCLQSAAALRRRMVISWVLHAWQSFVMDQREILHKFLVIRCAHSRRLQLAALAGLWMHASNKRSQRAALCAARQRAARKMLRGWRSRVLFQKHLLERVLEFVAVRAQRLLHRCLLSWQDRTKRKRKHRVLLESCAKARAQRHRSAAFTCWCQHLDKKALLQRVFMRAEQAWEGALAVRCSLRNELNLYRIACC